MYSSNLDKYFFNKCDKNNVQNRLESMFCSIDPEYAQAFNDYRKSILNTLENGSQI